MADRAYDDTLRQTIAAQGAWANIKPMLGRVKVSAFSHFLCSYWNLVERFFSKLMHFRAVTSRYEKHAANYLAPPPRLDLHLLRAYEFVTQ